MKLHKVADDTLNFYFERLSSPNGKVFMAILPVIFGYRVVAYTKGSVGPSLNWCGGGNQTHVEALYSMMKAILEKREEDEHVFDNLPQVSVIKPFFNDVAFTHKICREAGHHLQKVHLPPLEITRAAFFQ